MILYVTDLSSQLPPSIMSSPVVPVSTPLLDLSLKKPSRIDGLAGDFLVISFSAISGATWAQSEILTNHYDAFSRRFPTADRQYFDPSISWLNKYYNRDPSLGRTKLPVQLTDARHLLNSVAFSSAILTGVSIPLASGNFRPRVVLRRCILSCLSYSLSNHLVYRFYKR